jgi:hypothetical protein
MYVDWKNKKNTTNKKGNKIPEEKILMHEVEGEESIIPPKATLTYNEKKEFDSLMRQIAK